MRGWILLALLLWLPSGCSQAQPGPEPPTVPPDLAPCGVGDTSIPNFALTDDNSNSPTHGQTVALNDFSGKVVVIYWMTAT
jgi:hypothetical protein